MSTSYALIAAAILLASSVHLSCRAEHPSDRDVADSLRGPSSADSAVGMTAGDGPDPARESLSGYALDTAPDAMLTLPPSLREVSGIVFSGDGRLFAHNDERGSVSQVDPSTGAVIKEFAAGVPSLREDLEDIAIAGDTFYLVNSAGKLFAFVEGGGGGNVQPAGIPTRLGRKNNVEGLCLDPVTRTLLLACKEDPGGGRTNTRAVYAFDLVKHALLPSPRFLVDLHELKRRFGLKEFMPSAIGRHPLTGNFYLLSAVGNSVIELSPGGRILACASLPKKYHEQPEGIAFDGSARLFISNEGTHRGRIAVYRYNER